MKKINEFMLREIAGEFVAVPVGAATQNFNGMITMTETAAFLYEHIEEAGSFQELIDLLRSEYEVDEETAGRDVVYLINQMLQMGMIALSDPGRNW